MKKSKATIKFSEQWARERANSVDCKCGRNVKRIYGARRICPGCGHWVYKDKLTELKYELKEKGVLINV